MLVHLAVSAEEGAPPEAAALFARAHQKFGPAPLPRALVASARSPVLFRDAMLNLERFLSPKGDLGREEALLVGVAMAAGLGAATLARWFDALAQEAGVQEAARRGAVEVAIACRTVNAWYRAGVAMKLPGGPPGLRATPMVQPALPKRTAELVSVAMSVAMACATCTAAHIEAAGKAGASTPQVEEVVRLQAVIVGLVPLDVHVDWGTE